MPGVGGNQERSTCRRTRARSTYKGTHTRMTQHTYKYKGTQKHTQHTRMTQHTQHTYKVDLRDAPSTRTRSTRSTRSTRASTHAATPFVLVVPCAAASRRVASRPHVFSGQVQRGERRRRRRLTSCPGRVQRGERRSLGGSCRFVEVEMVSGDFSSSQTTFSSSEQGRGKRLVIHTWPRKCGPGDADVGREREGLRSPPHRRWRADHP